MIQSIVSQYLDTSADWQDTEVTFVALIYFPCSLHIVSLTISVVHEIIPLISYLFCQYFNCFVSFSF